MNNLHKTLFLLALSAFALSGCENTKKELGLTRSSPDEFTVVHRAPLALPPDYTLRPPTPGAPRPQDDVTGEEARTAVFGDDAAATSAPAKKTPGWSGADTAFLKDTGGDQANPDIRPQVDAESAKAAPVKKPAIQRLLSIGDKPQPATSVVDPEAEAARIKKDQQTGQPVTAGGDTPSTQE